MATKAEIGRRALERAAADRQPDAGQLSQELNETRKANRWLRQQLKKATDKLRSRDRP